MKTGRVYKIIVQEGNECYVGSTFNTLRDRFGKHKGLYKKSANKCSVSKLFDKYGVDKCKIILIKEYEVEDRKHLEAYETLWICKLKSINMVMPFSNKIREIRNMRKKEHYQKNKESINESRKDYRKEYYENNKEKHHKLTKEWYENNKEKHHELSKKHYEKNKEKINAKRGEKIPCESCGKIMRRDSISKHKKRFHLN